MILMGPQGPENIISIPDNLTETLFEEKLRGVHDAECEISRINEAHFAMDMRARFNSHRELEIYHINVDSDINEDEFMDICRDNPAGMLKLLKEKGKVL